MPSTILSIPKKYTTSGIIDVIIAAARTKPLWLDQLSWATPVWIVLILSWVVTSKGHI